MRKTLLSFIAIFGLAMMVMHSCGQMTKKVAVADTLSFDTLTVDTIVPYSDKADSPRCELKLSILCAKGANADVINDSILRYVLCDDMCDSVVVAPEGQVMRQVVDSFVSSYIKEYKEECANLEKAGELGVSSNNQYVVSTKVSTGRDGLVNYVIEGYTYTGGAHGSSFTKALNFDTSTGVCLSLGDAFVNVEDSVIQNKILDKLMTEYKVKDIDKLKEAGVFMFAEPYVPDNFILGPDSVTFIYMSDEIAPHALGEIRVTLAYPDLKE